jgi:hypothetical protein
MMFLLIVKKIDSVVCENNTYGMLYRSCCIPLIKGATTTEEGVADLNKIGITAEPISDHKKSYRLSDNINDHLVWMNPA